MVRHLIPIILFAFFFCFSTICFSAEGHARSRERTVHLGDLHLSTMDRPGKGIVDGEYVVKFSRQGKSVYTGECAFRVHDPRIVAGVPHPSCRSLLAYCYSGGAHCCMTVIIATECKSSGPLTLIDFAHSSGEVAFVDINSRGAKAIKVTDWQFAYYTVEDSELQLSFADSPGIRRLVVFDSGRWRVDRIAEFGDFYARLAKEAGRSVRVGSRGTDSTESRAAKAIRAAYYSYMSGMSAGDSAEELKSLLPKSWKPESEKIFEDIRRAANEFNPVEILE